MVPKNKDYDKQVFRLFSILNQLDSGNKVSTRDLSEQHNVSLRTVQRDIELLNSAGFLLASPAKGVHSFVDGFTLKKASLTSEEASLLSFLYEIAKSLGTGFEKSCGNIIKKVIQKEYESPYYAKLPQGPGLKMENPFIKTLEDAICDQEKIQLTYEAAEGKKEYKLGPLKIIYYEGFWYLLAQADGKKGIQKFRLEKIRDAEMLGESFSPSGNLQSMLDESVNVWFSGKRDKKVLLKVDKEIASYFEQKTYFPMQKIKKRFKDGSLLIETMIGQDNEVIFTVKHWMPHIMILEPEELNGKIKKLIEEYKKKI